MSEVVVIVDDEPYILHVLAVKLRNAGYKVLTAADGQEALEVCLCETPCLIITDYQMPYLNGLEFCLKYREISGKKIPAMIITAREFAIEDDAMSQAGIEMIVTKPFSPREIVRHTRRIINKYRVSSGAA